MIRLQCCKDCGKAQHPPREVCGACLSDRQVWETAEALPARILGRTRLHHSNEPGFRARLPLHCALVQFEAGPVAVCFLARPAAAGDAVRVTQDADDLLLAS